MEVGDRSRGMSEIGPYVGDEGCSWGCDWEDSPRPEVLAFFGGGGLLDGRG